MSKQSKLLSRDQWLEQGRIVCVTNAEAKAVHNYFEGHAGLHRGAWHAFDITETVPVEQVQQIGEAASL